MPTAIDLDLRARSKVSALPDRLHGMACALFEGSGADHTAEDKPFTVWPLRKDDPDDDRWLLRLNWLPDDPPPQGLPAPRHLRLGSTVLAVRQRHIHQCTYAEMAAGPPTGRAMLSFCTPTYFSRNGRSYPLPDPVLVYQSLYQRWNQRAPVPCRISEDMWAALRSEVIVGRVDIHTQAIPAAHRMAREGFVGDAVFSVRTEEVAVRVTFAALTRAATFLGVGAQTTRGFGVVTSDQQ